MTQTFTSPIGTVHTVPRGFNRKRKGESGEWGNSSGSDATREKRNHILNEIVPLLDLWTDGEQLECVCGCVVPIHGKNTFDCDRALTEGDENSPYAPGLIVPVCSTHNRNSDSRRQVVARIRLAAERVARFYDESEEF